MEKLSIIVNREVIHCIKHPPLITLRRVFLYGRRLFKGL